MFISTKNCFINKTKTGFVYDSLEFLISKGSPDHPKGGHPLSILIIFMTNIINSNLASLRIGF